MDKIELIDRAELMEKLRIVFPCSSCWEKKEPCIGLCYSVKMAVILTPTIDAAPVRRGEWVLEESPYAEHEESMDGESHPRYVCSLCHCEAGFGCDPDGFATDQHRSNFCPHCGADMRREAHREPED